MFKSVVNLFRIALFQKAFVSLLASSPMNVSFTSPVSDPSGASVKLYPCESIRLLLVKEQASEVPGCQVPFAIFPHAPCNWARIVPTGVCSSVGSNRSSVVPFAAFTFAISLGSLSPAGISIAVIMWFP